MRLDENTRVARLLASVSGLVNQHRLRQNEYLVAENSMLSSHASPSPRDIQKSKVLRLLGFRIRSQRRSTGINYLVTSSLLRSVGAVRPATGWNKNSSNLSILRVSPDLALIADVTLRACCRIDFGDIPLSRILLPFPAFDGSILPPRARSLRGRVLESGDRRASAGTKYGRCGTWKI